MQKNKIFFHCSLFSVLCSLFSCGALAATQHVNSAPKPVSSYGLIQNVQNYSSNPFWSPNSPYNLRMPQPVYAQGTDVDTGDCQRVVSALVASYCATNNNCIDTRLNDARPTLIVQLASISGHNYVTPCAGFIDSEFKTYRDNNAIAAPRANSVTAFPTVTQPVKTSTDSGAKIKNPYSLKTPDWATEMQERDRELKQLQSQNGGHNEHVVKMDFPNTIADISFQERIKNAAAGYEPYKDKSAYQQLKLESEATHQQRMARRKQILTQWQEAAAETQTQITSEQKNQIIAKIAQALKDAQK